MDDNNNNNGWYKPLSEEPANRETGAKQKKPRRFLKVMLIIVLALAAVAGSSMLAYKALDAGAASVQFYGGPIPGIKDGDGSASSGDDMPDNFDDFFSAFFTETTTETAKINIPVKSISGHAMFEMQPAEGDELSLQELYKQCAPTVVGITGYVDGKEGYYWGTGVILSSDGVILTNTHVIDGCDSAEVTLSDDTEYEAKLVGADSISDVAILKIEAKGLPYAVFGDSAEISVGEPVAAIGNPLGETFRLTLTNGIISAIERGVEYNGRTLTLLQTNTALNEGNSGGPLFNMRGQVIGITNMKMMSSYSSIEGIGFAIPSSTAVSVANAIVKDGEVRGRASIGITVGSVPDNASSYYNIPQGLYVSAVVENSDAAAKGIKKGDILTAVNGIPVSTTNDVSEIKDGLGVGDTLTLTIWRNGDTFDVDIVMMDTLDIYG